MSGAVVLLIVFLIILLILLGAAVLVLISVWSGGRKKSSDRERESGRGGGLFADKRMCLGFRVERPADRKTAELLEIMIEMMDTIRGKMICDDEVKRGIMRAIDDMKLDEGDGFCDAKSFAAASEEVKELRMLAPQISALQKLVCENGRIGVHEFKGMLRGFVEAVCYD